MYPKKGDLSGKLVACSGVYVRAWALSHFLGVLLKCQWLFQKSSASLSQISLSVSLGDGSLSPLHHAFIPETRRGIVGCAVGWFSYSHFAITSCFLGAGSAPLPPEGLRGMLQWPGKARLLLKPVSWKGLMLYMHHINLANETSGESGFITRTI